MHEGQINIVRRESGSLPMGIEVLLRILDRIYGLPSVLFHMMNKIYCLCLILLRDFPRNMDKKLIRC